MSSQNSNKNNRKILQRLGEDVAYTYKGLYKTSDWLEYGYKILLFLPLIYSMFSLVFDLKGGFIKFVGCLTLLATFWVLIHKSEYTKIKGYRELANDFKKIYDELEIKYYKYEFEDVEKIKEKIDELRRKTSEYPISLIGRIWTVLTIKKEMDLSWIYQKE